jgi:hypothetical protein
LVVTKGKERLAVSKQAVKKMDMEIHIQSQEVK